MSLDFFDEARFGSSLNPNLMYLGSKEHPLSIGMFGNCWLFGRTVRDKLNKGESTIVSRLVVGGRHGNVPFVLVLPMVCSKRVARPWGREMLMSRTWAGRASGTGMTGEAG